uniref:Uncharacterized protein n=1 Tax=Octopus bimaculoides TaxID=37653 RepID=A0A0L8IEU4_OCTBM
MAVCCVCLMSMYIYLCMHSCMYLELFFLVYLILVLVHFFYCYHLNVYLVSCLYCIVSTSSVNALVVNSLFQVTIAFHLYIYIFFFVTCQFHQFGSQCAVAMLDQCFIITFLKNNFSSADHRPIESRNHLTTAEFIPTPIFIGSLVFVFLLASGLGFIVGFKVSTCKDSQDNDSTIDDATANLRVHQENDHYYAKPDNRAPTKYNNYWDGSPRAGKVPNNGSEFRPVNTYTNVKGKTYL